MLERTVVPVCLVDRGGRLMSLWADTVVRGGVGVDAGVGVVLLFGRRN